VHWLRLRIRSLIIPLTVRLQFLLLLLLLSQGVVLLRAEAAALDPAPTVAEPWWRHAVTYELLVRSFQDSDGDGVGDLAGVQSRLGYLHDLGVDALWLMPIFPSPSYHGYDVTDYRGVNADYGTIDTFKQLLNSAHALGMHIILDVPLNHSSSHHPWFQAGLNDPQSPLRSRYVWRSTIPNWSALPNNASHWHQVGTDYYYAYFSASLPDFDWTNVDVYQQLSASLKYWIDLGVDGFRLDAARYLVEGPNGESDTAATHAIWQRLAAEMKANQPGTLLVGEVWAGQSTINAYYGAGNELDQCFAFPLAGGLLASLKSGDGTSFVNALSPMLAAGAPQFFSAPFLTNHDQIRIATELAGNTASLKLAAAALLTLPGTPYLYYGEEIGLPNGTNTASDQAKRTPMPWDHTLGSGRGFTNAAAPWEPFATDDPTIEVASESVDPDSLLATYQSLLALRHSEPGLATGSAEIVPSASAQIVVLKRVEVGATLLTVLNFGATAVTPLTMTVDWLGNMPAASVIFGQVTVSTTLTDGKLAVSVPTIPPQSAAVLRLGDQ